MLNPVNAYFKNSTKNQLLNDGSPFKKLFEICQKTTLNTSEINYAIYLLSIIKSTLASSIETDMKDLNMDTLVNDFNTIAKQILQNRLSKTVDVGQLFVTNKIALTSKMQDIITALNSGTVGPSLEDALFYEYARTGEATLNQEVSNLGDAISTLSSIVNQLNRIEVVLAIDPGSSYINERGELTIRPVGSSNETASDVPLISNSDLAFFYNRSEFNNIEIDPTGGYKNAVIVLIESLDQLKNLASLLPTTSDQYKEITNVTNFLETTYGIRSWVVNGSVTETSWADRQGGTTANGELYWKTQFASGTTPPRNFARLFMDNQFRKSVGDAISIAQSQNDIQKQQLAKSLFVYQEFIKSSSSLLDMTFKTSKSMATKISR